MFVCVLAWLAPTVMTSGGPAKFWRVNWEYLKSNAGETSGLFGANERLWETTLVWLAVWTFCILLALTLPAILAWNRGFGVGRERSLFLWTWLLPPLAFAAGIHVADPGHILAMLPPLCLASAHLTERAAERFLSLIPSFLTPVLVVFPPLLVWLGFSHAEMVPWIIGMGGIVMGALWRVQSAAYPKWIPRWQASALMVAPAIVLSLQIFFQKNWYFGATDDSPIAERIRRDINSGFRQMSYDLVRHVTDTDDRSLRDIIALARERKGAAVAVWDRGAVDWRKLSYYAPWLPVIVVAPDKARVAMGPDVRSTGNQLQLTAPPRLILLTRSPPQSFEPVEWRGAQAYIDLPMNQHEAHVGAILLCW